MSEPPEMPKETDWLRLHRLSVPKTRGDANHKIYKRLNDLKRDRENLHKAIDASILESCPQSGSMGVHSESFHEDDPPGECAWCGATREKRE